MKEFITRDERELLFKKANYHFGRKEYRANPAGPHRYVTRLDEEPKLDDLVKKMRDRVKDTFGLHECVEDPVLNKLISRIEPGGFIQQHTDSLDALKQYAKFQNKEVKLPKEGANFRCNIMVNMHNETACPIIGDSTIDISECDAWGFLPSKILHGTQVITGGPRIIFGFGFIVPENFKI